MKLQIFLGFMTAFLISYGITPAVIKFAHYIGAIDVPKDNRRMHTKPIPRLGGLGISIAFMVSALIFGGIHREIIAIIVSSIIIVVTGMFDDTKSLKALTKLILQIICACVVIFSGVKIEFLGNPFTGELIWLGFLSVPITLFWIVGITNCINLIDGLDGLAAGISSISAITLAVVSFLNGYQSYAVIFLCLAGSSIGFLPYNFNPAKIFMGDTGSLFLGFILSVMSIEGTVKTATLIAVIVPVLALAVPIFDTTFAIIRRKLAGRPVMEADKGHLHHRLLAMGFSHKHTVLLLYAVSGILGSSAIIIAKADFKIALSVFISDLLFIFYSVYRLKILHKSE